MPRAGWCRECGEWVWVDEGDACQHGHGSECVENIHEQEAPAEVIPAYVGVGEMPLELNRFNWGAFCLPLFWGAVYGSWPVMAAWMLALASPLVVSSLFGQTGASAQAASAVIAATVVSEVVAGAARIWAGVNANRLVWRRETRRLDFVQGSKPRFTVARFSSRQRIWALWGLVIVGVGTVASAPFTEPTWREYGLSYVGASMPVMWLAAEIVLGRWLDVRMRADAAASPSTNGEAL